MQDYSRQLEAAVCNPNGPPMLFATISPAAKHSPYLFARLKGCSLDTTEVLSKEERESLQRDNPVDVAVKFEY